MAIFRYEALDGSGKAMRGAMEATNPQEVASRLTEKGYRQVEVKFNQATVAAAPVVVQAPPIRAGFTWSVVNPNDLSAFFRQMSSLLHAGFMPSSALSDLAMRTANTRLKNALAAMARETVQGESLALSMGRHAGVFPPHTIGLVQAGETGGFLPFAFEEAALHCEMDAALRQGLWLPKILIWQAVWSVLILQPIVMNLGQLVHGLAGVMVMVRHLMFFWIPLGMLLHVLAEVGGRLWRQPNFITLRDSLSLRIPVMARLAHKRAIAAFTRVLRRLLLAGVSTEIAFVTAAQAVPNTVLRDRFLRGVTALRSGQGLDAAMQATGMLEHDPLQMLITGQKTGQWTEMLDRVTSYYQEEAVRATEAAKSAQKRLGILITIISMGYVTIVITYYGYKAMFAFAESFGE